MALYSLPRLAALPACVLAVMGEGSVETGQGILVLAVGIETGRQDGRNHVGHLLRAVRGKQIEVGRSQRSAG